MTVGCRERPVFAGIGGKLVECKPDGLCRSWVQAQLRTLHGNTRTNEIGEMRELGTHQIRYLHPLPFIPDEQVLIG